MVYHRDQRSISTLQAEFSDTYRGCTQSPAVLGAAGGRLHCVVTYKLIYLYHWRRSIKAELLTRVPLSHVTCQMGWVNAGALNPDFTCEFYESLIQTYLEAFP